MYILITVPVVIFLCRIIFFRNTEIAKLREGEYIRHFEPGQYLLSSAGAWKNQRFYLKETEGGNRYRLYLYRLPRMGESFDLVLRGAPEQSAAKIHFTSMKRDPFDIYLRVQMYAVSAFCILMSVLLTAGRIKSYVYYLSAALLFIAVFVCFFGQNKKSSMIYSIHTITYVLCEVILAAVFVIILL